MKMNLAACGGGKFGNLWKYIEINCQNEIVIAEYCCISDILKQFTFPSFILCRCFVFLLINEVVSLVKQMQITSASIHYFFIFNCDFADSFNTDCYLMLQRDNFISSL